jgi:hypothetical protein
METASAISRFLPGTLPGSCFFTAAKQRYGVLGYFEIFPYTRSSANYFS